MKLTVWPIVGLKCQTIESWQCQHPRRQSLVVSQGLLARDDPQIHLPVRRTPLLPHGLLAHDKTQT
jgi:hypothetical protein